MKKYIVLLIAASFLGTGCKDKYQEGFNAGKDEGIADGQAAGQTEGFNNGYNSTYDGAYDVAYNNGLADGTAQGYSEGQVYYETNNNYEDGFADGFSQGYAQGGTDGFNDGYDVGYDQTYNPAFNVGESDGYYDGYDNGYNDGAIDGDADGYADGYNDGEAIAFDEGYNDGYNDGEVIGYNNGYNVGHNDGYSDGSMGSSVKSKNPSVKLAAMVNSDLIDYSKLEKFDSKSVVSMGMSHADNGTVDMEKLAALKEKHYLNQMGRQIQARFGLSADRSMKIATVAHQFNKMSGTRQLTEKDAELFAVGVIGTSLKNVEKAMEKSMKGDSELFNNLLSDIATHNDTTPEKVNGIISTIFF